MKEKYLKAFGSEKEKKTAEIVMSLMDRQVEHLESVWGEGIRKLLMNENDN